MTYAEVLKTPPNELSNAHSPTPPVLERAPFDQIPRNDKDMETLGHAVINDEANSNCTGFTEVKRKTRRTKKDGEEKPEKRMRTRNKFVKYRKIKDLSEMETVSLSSDTATDEEGIQLRERQIDDYFKSDEFKNLCKRKNNRTPELLGDVDKVNAVEVDTNNEIVNSIETDPTGKHQQIIDMKTDDTMALAGKSKFHVEKYLQKICQENAQFEAKCESSRVCSTAVISVSKATEFEERAVDEKPVSDLTDECTVKETANQEIFSSDVDSENETKTVQTVSASEWKKGRKNAAGIFLSKKFKQFNKPVETNYSSPEESAENGEIRVKKTETLANHNAEAVMHHCLFCGFPFHQPEEINHSAHPVL